MTVQIGETEQPAARGLALLTSMSTLKRRSRSPQPRIRIDAILLLFTVKLCDSDIKQCTWILSLGDPGKVPIIAIEFQRSQGSAWHTLVCN